MLINRLKSKFRYDLSFSSRAVWFVSPMSNVLSVLGGIWQPVSCAVVTAIASAVFFHASSSVLEKSFSERCQSITPIG